MNRMTRYSFPVAPAGNTANISVKIPGIFGGLVRSPTNQGGRIISKVEIGCANPLPGDYVHDLQLTDDDGVVPQPARAQFPNYPVIATWADPDSAAANVGKYLLSSEMNVLVPINDQSFVPSQLYLKATLTKAQAMVGGDTVFMNVLWDDLR